MVFNKSLLSSSVAMAIATTSAYAQEMAVEEVVVTGIRGSLMRAMDVKRDAKGVVDAISAEDIGKMPDTNLAESLQRITGVSISRSRGEGAEVTVRGFAGSFNLVTLNGRQMPTTGGNRSFDFGNIASEGVAGVEIYKTGKAHVSTGGIGSTINILTTKPLKNPGLKASVGVKAVHDTSTEDGEDLTPEISGIISQTFADDTFGVSLTASYQERDNASQTAGVGGDGWRPFRGTDDTDITLGTGPENINRPQGDDIYSVPNNVQYDIAEYHRERVNGQLTMQWEPVESLTATMDYTYSELTLDKVSRNYSGWFAGANFASEYTDGPITAPISYSDDSERDIAMASSDTGTKSENESLGFNFEWRPNDNLTLAFDYHDSTAEDSPNSIFGNSNTIQVAPYIRDITTGYFDQELPILELSVSAPMTAESMQIAGSVFQTNFNWMDMEQSQFSGTWEFDEGGSIDFGFSSTENTNRSAQGRVQRDAWSGQNGGTGLFTDLMVPVSSAGDFDQISGSNDPRRWTEYFTWDTAAVIARAEALQQLDPSDPMYLQPQGTGQEASCPSGFCTTSEFNDFDRTTTEESSAWYLQVNTEAMLGDMEANLSFGLRYEETDVNSVAQTAAYDGVEWTAANEFINTVAEDEDGNPLNDFTELSAKYDYILPNVDFSLNVNEEIVVRASYSQTMSRPDFVAIQGGVVIDSIVRVDGGTASAGNPGLLPFLSQNYDLSLEWYYGEASYASVGYFRKDVENFIASGELEDQVLIPGLAHPFFSPLVEAAQAAGAANNSEIRQYIFDNFASDPAVDAVNEIISGVSGVDADVEFDVNTSINIEDRALVEGWELAVQHNFGESGFGLIANYTFVDGDFGYDLSLIEGQFGLSGLSDSANFIGYYDKDGLQGRIAYNWRDEFLSGTGQEPVFIEEYGQVDVNVSYDVTDTVTVFVEGLNITDETTRGHTRTVNQVTSVEQTGPRFNIGVRAAF